MAILSINIFFLISIIIIKIEPFINYFKYYLEYKKIENYLLLCKNKNHKIINNKKSNKPKISIISPIYNSEKFLLRFIKSIENQNFVDIEIIMVDDCSFDKSVKIIKKYKNEDKRIILIRNKKNKGTFMNRHIGVIFSKSKYILIPDPDDILSKDILKLCYKYAEKYNYEIIRFNIYIGNGKSHINNIFQKLNEKTFYQPELSKYIFYGIDELKIIDCCLCNKFFKKDAYIKALNSLKNEYLNMHISYSEDSLMNYIVYRIAKSFIFLKKIGYYYIKNFSSITNNLFGETEWRIKCGFKFLGILYEFSKNSKYEKDMSNLFLNNFIRNNNIEKQLLSLNYNFDKIFYYNIINIYLNSKYITKENKSKLKYYKYLIKII